MYTKIAFFSTTSADLCASMYTGLKPYDIVVVPGVYVDDD